MGTRSTIKFYDVDEKDEPILCVYQQYDGYISGVGYDLANFLKSKTIINGFCGQTMEGGFANGMGCLAAQFVAENKTKIGRFYLTNKNDMQEYNYEVRLNDENQLIIKVDEFEGTPEELLNYCEE